MTAVLALWLGVAAAAAPAFAAECEGGGSTDDDGGVVKGECSEEAPGTPGSSTVEEIWHAYCASDVGPFQPGDTIEYEPSEPATESDIEYHGLDPTGEHWWWFVHCVRDGQRVHGVEILISDTPGVPPEVIRDQATARIDLPAPLPASSPPLGGTFVNLPTWLWVDASGWEPLEASETQGLVTVTVRATPRSAVWVMGDGEGVVCHGPGVAWESGLGEDATDCSYTYTRSSYGLPRGEFEGSVTVTWEFEWWINGAAQGAFGSLDSATPFQVGVAEIQAVETGG